MRRSLTWATLSLSTYHIGFGYSASTGYFWQTQQNYQTFVIPPYPTIRFTQIDVTNPNNVVWRFDTGGQSPYQINFDLDRIHQFTSGNVAQVDQNWYPSGYSRASISGINYGIGFSGPNCQVQRLDNQSFTQTNAANYRVGGDAGVWCLPAYNGCRNRDLCPQQVAATWTVAMPFC